MVYHLLECKIWTYKKIVNMTAIKFPLFSFINRQFPPSPSNMSFSIQIFVISLICQSCEVYICHFKGQVKLIFVISLEPISKLTFLCFEIGIPLIGPWSGEYTPYVIGMWQEIGLKMLDFIEGGNWQFAKEKGIKKWGANWQDQPN